MAERRVAEVVRKAGAVDHVGIATERSADLSTDLRDLQRVCKPCTCEIVRAGYQNLRFRAEPAQCGRVDESGAVALEGGAGSWIWGGSGAQRSSSNALYPSLVMMHRLPMGAALPPLFTGLQDACRVELGEVLGGQYVRGMLVQARNAVAQAGEDLVADGVGGAGPIVGGSST